MLALEAFKRSLTDRGLRQHLLTVQARTVQDLVVAAEAYQQAGQVPGINPQRFRPQVAGLADFSTPDDPPESMLERLMKAVEANSKAINQLANASRANPPATNNVNVSTRASTPKTLGPCYKCKGPHLKINCPLSMSGNDERPRQ
jgi:hypothetical protein